MATKEVEHKNQKKAAKRSTRSKVKRAKAQAKKQAAMGEDVPIPESVQKKVTEAYREMQDAQRALMQKQARVQEIITVCRDSLGLPENCGIDLTRMVFTPPAVEKAEAQEA